MQALMEIKAFRFLKYLFSQFFTNGGIINASALTYTTLFAVVPLMTVSYAMLAAIPTFQGVGEQVQGWVFSNFVPATGEVVQNYLKDFTGQAQKLTGVGIIFLIITSVMMMRNIEVAFNRIWRVNTQRKGVASFLLYWAVLSLGPILIGLGLFMTSYLATLPLISDATEMVGKGRLLSMLPTVMSCAAFTLLYAAVPNCKVPFKNAFMGGLVVALLFETAKRAFALFATQFPSYELIYGAFAAVPLFLVWIFISWFIILMGCELTRALTVYKDLHKTSSMSHLHRIVAVLNTLWDAQQRGETLTDDMLLQRSTGLDQSNWDEYSQILIDNHIVSRTEQGQFLLARDMGALTLNEFATFLPWPLPVKAVDVEEESAWLTNLQNRLNTVTDFKSEQFSITLEQLFYQAGKSASLNPVKEEGVNG